MEIRSIDECIRDYKDIKQQHYRFVQLVKNTSLNKDVLLYRGDKIYPDLIEEGKILNFYNNVSSWSSDSDIAIKFATDKGGAPEWYYDEGEWCSDEPYPYKDRKESELVPVLYYINSNNNTKGIRMADFIDDDHEEEYVIGNVKYKVISSKYNQYYYLVELEVID